MEHSSQDNRRLNARERAQQWMTKGGLIRDDSDDELGVEDHPWIWIYEEDRGSGTSKGADSEESTARRDNPSRTTPFRRRRRIIGARMGNFECRLGQVVLLRSPEPGKDWAGIITEFLLDDEEEDERGEPVKSANIMWLASPDEFMATKNKRRPDALPKEQYVTTDFNVNPLTSINGKARVMSKDAFYAKYPGGNPPRGKDALAEYNKCIICRRGVNQLQGRYTEEFVWEDVYCEGNIFKLIDLVKSGLKVAKKRKADEDSDVGDYRQLCMYRPVLTGNIENSMLLQRVSCLRRPERSKKPRSRQLRNHDDSERLLRHRQARGEWSVGKLQRRNHVLTANVESLSESLSSLRLSGRACFHHCS